MKLRCYVGGPSSELPRVLRYVEALDASGTVSITRRWWLSVQRHGVGNDHTLTVEQQQVHALACLNGVSDADLVWFLWPEGRSHGVPLELGFATGLAISPLDTQLVVSGARASECIFTSLAWRDASDDVALVEVLRRAAEVSHAR